MKKLLYLALSSQLLSAATPLTSGKIVNDTVKQKEKKFYNITVPKNKSVHVNLTELEADVDLYVKRGNEVRLRFNDCYSSNSNTQNEECTLTNEGETSTYSILVNGFRASSYKLKATIEDAEEIPTLTNNPIEDTVAQKKTKQYRVAAKAGDTLKVTLSNLTADADLRVKIGRKANRHTFDCKSTNGGTKEDSCSVTLEEDDWVYVQVDGYRAANYSLKATLEYPFLDKANKAYEKNKNCESEEVVCTDKGVIYVKDKILLSKRVPSPQYLERIYAVTNKNHFKEIRNEYCYDNELSFLKKLKNTDLIVVLSRPEMYNSRIYTVNIYNPQGEKVIPSFSYNIFMQDKYFNSAETIENGSKLVFTYASWIYGEDIYKKFKDTYDITNTSDAKLISHKKIGSFK